MSIEAMKLALEALEQYVNVVVSTNDPNNWTPTVADGGKPAREAITALRTAIEAAEKQKPVAWMCHPFGDTEVEFSPHQECENCTPLYTTPPAAPVQEPSTRACRSCGGSGERDTGIAESPIAICKPCAGTGQITTPPAAPVQDIEHCIWARNGNTPCPNTAAQRQWVGLTDEDVTTSHPYSVTRDKGCFHAGADWANTWLREKNGGQS